MLNTFKALKLTKNCDLVSSNISVRADESEITVGSVFTADDLLAEIEDRSGDRVLSKSAPENGGKIKLKCCTTRKLS
jgi:hypothetical protein